MNITKVIQANYQNGRISLTQMIPMELLVTSHFTSIMKNSKIKNRHKTYLKVKLIKRKVIFVKKLIVLFFLVIIEVVFIGLALLLILE